MTGGECCFGVIIIALIIGALLYEKAKNEKAIEARKYTNDQNERALEHLERILNDVRRSHRHILSEVITDEQINALKASSIKSLPSPHSYSQAIDNADTPDFKKAFRQALAKRIEAHRGLTLGNDANHLPVKLTQHFRDRHVYIIGKSGSGKTTLLRQMIMQDMKAGNGVGVIAPEQEMITEELLPFVPEHRLDDVIYFNPADTISPISFNPLHLDEGEDLDRRVDENLTIFNRLMEGETTPRTNEILRQSFYALLPLPETTLLDIPRLLDRENGHYRNQMLAQIEDYDTLHFWRDIYPQFPKNAHLPIVYRLSKFTRPKSIKNVLCQPRQSINFREIMDEGKIAFFNLSDGILGEQNSQLLGQLIVSKFQLAVMGRANISKRDRRPFYLYIDEFQTFTSTASASYEKILSRARKYRLALILAHQQTAQIPSPLLKEIFGNVSTMISFVVSTADAKRLAPEFISTSGGMVEKTEPDWLVSIDVGQTYIKIGTTSFRMRTHLVSQRPNWELGRKVIERSRINYGIPVQGKRPPPPQADTPFAPFDLSDPDDF